MRVTSHNTGLGGMRGRQTPQLVTVQPRPTLGTVVVVNAARLVGRLLRWLCHHPLVTGPMLAVVVLLRLLGTTGVAHVLLAGTVGLAAGLVVWRDRWPASFRRVLASRWRALVVYRRLWQPAMVTCGLATTVGEREYLPEIRRVVSETCRDRLLVELLSGQAPEDFEARTSQLAHTFEATECRVVADRPGRIWLEFTHADPLVEVVPALAPAEPPDLTALPVGTREDGTPWTLRLLGTHLLIAGATGSGKGSVLWSLIRALGPALRDRSVQVWAVDPKGGMELTPGAGLFAWFAYAGPAAMVELLEDAVAFMRHRSERLRQAGLRLHQPTPEDPLVVVLVDELASLTAYVGDRELKKRADAALQLLLSQGRAAGVLVVAALQDPGKDVLPYRDLFPTRVALRLLEDTQIDMVLGRSARARGAACDRIPPSLPGVGYVVIEGIREPVRVRAAHIDDNDLARMVDEFAPPAVATDQPPLQLVKGDA
ncbi:FtsK/SpoIIIE domain-containing protein [Nocardioides insulae]|uniref:FtsK/SpoIIIE domain-containing protein n=1 Tax=Nocardioides insulae TaxID=394734 RepID=UPI00146D523C|nr:FtsK/SpoIIIE domain-containing protein [Nocardioides insulae]